MESQHDPFSNRHLQFKTYKKIKLLNQTVYEPTLAFNNTYLRHKRKTLRFKQNGFAVKNVANNLSGHLPKRLPVK